jgi:hypothetical protein
VPTDFYLITNQTSSFWDDPLDGVFGTYYSLVVSTCPHDSGVLLGTGYIYFKQDFFQNLVQHSLSRQSPSKDCYVVLIVASCDGPLLNAKGNRGAEMIIDGVDDSKIRGKPAYIPIPKGAWLCKKSLTLGP